MRSLRAAAARAAWLGLGASLAASACHGRASTPPHAAAVPDEPPAIPTEGFVVLPWGTRTYVEPRFGGVSARLGWPGTAPPPWPTTGYVARVVGQRDGFVEIAPILPPTSELHCGPLLEGEVFDVRLYVSPWSLAPVLAREHEVTLADGSSLSLHPGALAQPIPEDPQGRWAISAGGIRVRAAVPADAMALAYAAPVPMPMPPDRSFQLPEGRPFRFDGWPLEVELGFGQDVAIASVTPEGEEHVVELMSPCARVLARSDQAPVSWNQPGFDGHFMEFGLGAPEEVPKEVLEEVRILAPLELEAPDGVEGGVPDGVEGGVPGGVEGMVTIAPAEPPPPAPIEEPSLEGALGITLGGFEGTLTGTLPTRPEHAFEQGTPVYLSAAGPAAGTLADLRVFSEDGWAAGDRLCFHTSFGSRFDPSLPVCLPVAEARLRDPVADSHDFLPLTVRPGTLHVEGALDVPAVERALRRLRPELRRCVGEAIGRGNWPSGDLGLALDVDGKGAVTDVRSIAPPLVLVTDCAVTAAQRWRLPAPSDGKPAAVVLTVHVVQR